ncbi:MAG TPA: DNA helicase RecQ [Flavobacteriales bacterium]|nr:DNA helicase RecQ [Flavobacteriales bacterium]HPH83385.1 DNA helicase RecQ [Flavobacteriales bacterium]
MLEAVDTTIDLTGHLKKYFGFSKFKGEQEAIIRNILDGNDTFVIMPTGGGKSMCYQLPALISEGTAIIVSPLIALMKNQVDSIRNFGGATGIAHFLNSSLNKAEITRVREDITNGVTKLLYVAPESLTKDENVQFFREINISFFAIDEAHCISEWGHDFRPEYRRLRSIIEAIGTVPIMALTATATPKVQQDIMKNLNMVETTLFKSSFNRSNLYYEVRPKKNVVKEIIKFIKQHPGKSGIIYCLSRKKVEEIAETLNVNGIKALPYHAGLDASTRASHQDKFLMEEADVIVATIAFGMGIDKPDVRFVIHHEMPKSLEGYYQETGRAGRDGGEGVCLSFYSFDDIQKLEKFLKNKHVAEQEIGQQLLAETVGYAETSMCRRKYLLHYFGEEYDESGCNNMCDNCRHPKKKFDAMEDVCLVLDTVASLKGKFKDKHINHILTGTIDSVITSYKHDQLELFGKGSEHSTLYWSGVIRQAVVMGLLEKEIENYGTLHLTSVGTEFLENPQPVMITEDHDYSDTDDEDELAAAGQGAAAADEVLFSMLKDLTRKIAKRMNMPPYVIFQEQSLVDMTIQYPVTLDELKQIAGVGAGKAEKYGKEFVETIAQYVQENEIDRPLNMVVKSVVNKSTQKVFIIQSVDRKISLEDIASSKGLTLVSLIEEMEAIVYSGTRLDISYYIDDVIDEDIQDEIMDYFRKAETDSMAVAIQEMGDDEIGETELRLMRLKFISQFGN